MFLKQKLPQSLDNISDVILKIFFIVILCLGLYVLYDKYYLYALSGRQSVLYSSRADAVEEIEKNYTDAIGWLYIEDTIDEPLMQGENNTYYLNVGPDGAYSLRGSLFIDSRNSADFSDHYTLIYGHHMSYYQMFGALDHYFDEEYWTPEHEIATVTLKDSSQLKLKIFAIGSIDASVKEIFNPSEKTAEEVLHLLMTSPEFDINKMINISELKDKRIVCLSTCQTPDSTLRTCVLTYICNEEDEENNETE